MPLHPLLVHFAVVFVILAALGQIGAVLVPPRVRHWLGWVQPAFSAVTSLTVLLTARAGDELLSTHLGHADQDHQAALTHAGWGGETLTAWSWCSWSWWWHSGLSPRQRSDRSGCATRW